MPSSDLQPRSRRRRQKAMEVRLTVVVAFGSAEEDRVTVIDDRRIWMVGSIFQYRDRIAKLAMATLIRAALMQPKVAARILPGLSAVAQRAAARVGR
ncbi:MAG: hypothetical protein ACPHCJ_01010 [Oceanococcaceae bacterium]